MENIIYYYVVFTIVIMVKLHKHLKQETPDIPLSPDDPYKWLDIFDGMDLAFSAAGVIITLFLNSESKYYPAIFSIAIFLYLFAFIADNITNKRISLKRFLNIILMCIIFIVTFLVFLPNSKFLGISLNGLQKHDSNVKSAKKYRVMIPYQDLTLISHLGYNKSNNIYLVYETTISDTTIENIKTKALQKFETDKTIKPLMPLKNIDYTDKMLFVKYDPDKIYLTE
jgi:hypothetical protein